MNLQITKIKAGIFTILAAFFEAAFGLYIGRIVDAITMGDKNIFYERLLIALGLLVGGLIFSMLSRSNIYKDVCNRVESLKNKIYVRELNKDRQQTIDMANFTSKIDLVYNDDFINRWLIFEAVFTCAFSSIAVISINWIMFLVAIATSIIPMAIPGMFTKYVQNAASDYSKGSTKYTEMVSDTLSGRLEIVKYQVLGKFIQNHGNENKDFEMKRFKSKFANYNVSSITGMVAFSSFILVFFTGGLLAFNEMVSIGGVIGVIQLMNNIVNPIVGIASKKTAINSCVPVLEELNKEEELVCTNESKLTDEDIKEVTLSSNNIIYSYGNDEVNIIEGFSHDFYSGKKYLIQGESGSGKTTLAKILSGELQPKNGQVTINGKTINNIEKTQLSQIISYVDQSSYVFKDTIYNNIDMYRGFPKENIDYNMKNLYIDNLQSDKIVDDSNGISGGQKSRICLARAMMHLPKVLIVDEPTAALDEKNTDRIMRYLCSLPVTVIVISHHLNKELVDLFDDVVNFTDVYQR